MIDYTTFRSRVEVFLGANSVAIGVPVVRENTLPISVNEEHVEVFDQQMSSEQLGMASMGESPVSQKIGYLIFKIFTKRGTGTNRAKTIASSIEKLLTVPDVIAGGTFEEGILTAVGETEEGHLYQHNLSVMYQFIFGQND